MAMQSQGVLIRRISTVAGSSGVVASTNTIYVDSTQKKILWSNAAADFVAAGFTSSMRVTISGSTNSNTGIYTISAVAATALTLYDAVTAQAVGSNLAVQGNVYNTIGGIRGFQGPTGQAAVIDVTALNSTAKQKLIGLRDEGSISLDAFLITSAATVQQAAIRDDRATRTLRQYDILFADNDAGVSTSYPTGVNFDAYVSGFAITGQTDQAVTVNIGLEITSALKWIPKV